MNNETVVFGGYCHSAFPGLANFASESDYQIPFDEGNFVFYYKGDQQNHFTMINQKPFGYIYTDYESGGALSIAGDFILISWSTDFTHSCGNVYDMKCVEQSNFMSFYSNIQIVKYEAWRCHPTKQRLQGQNKAKAEF